QRTYTDVQQKAGETKDLLLIQYLFGHFFGAANQQGAFGRTQSLVLLWRQWRPSSFLTDLAHDMLVGRIKFKRGLLRSVCNITMSVHTDLQFAFIMSRFCPGIPV